MSVANKTGKQKSKSHSSTHSTENTLDSAVKILRLLAATDRTPNASSLAGITTRASVKPGRRLAPPDTLVSLTKYVSSPSGMISGKVRRKIGCDVSDW